MKIDDKYKFTFGKHKGEKISTVLHDDPGYLVWCHHNIDWFDLDDEIYQYADRIHTELQDERYNYLGDEFWRED